MLLLLSSKLEFVGSFASNQEVVFYTDDACADTISGANAEECYLVPTEVSGVLSFKSQQIPDVEKSIYVSFPCF